jgi:ERF superfamily
MNMSVYKKLNEARAKFHTLKLTKTGHNKFAGYNYFELADFLVPALNVFNEVGLCAIVSFEKEVATMTIHDLDMKSMGQGPQYITITSPMGGAALKGCHEVQNIGAVETYQRRYLWVAALEIVEHDALDATTGKGDFRVKPAEECFKLLQPEIQDLLRKAAPKIDQAMPDITVVMERYSWVLNNYDESDRNDVAAGLAHLLDSKTRSAIKKHQEENA